MTGSTDLIIEKLGRRGDGIGTLPDGRPVYVARALPGERVRVRLLADRGEGLGGVLEEIIAPAPERTDPPCPHYAACGGCALQHMKRETYRGWKETLVRETLARAGLAPEVWKDTVFIPEGTRRRATLAAFLQNGRVRLGYHRARSADIIDIPHCLVLSQRLQRFTEDVRPFLPRILTDSRPADIFVQDVDGALDLVFTGPLGKRKEPDLAVREAIAEMAQSCGVARISWRAKDRGEPEILLRPAPVLKRFGALAVELPPLAFLQPSGEGEAALVSAMLSALPERGKTADLFAGCGTFAGPLLARGEVLAVEGDRASADAVQVAAKQARGLSVARRDLFREPLSAKELSGFDAVVIDPPRAGARAQAEQIADSGVPVVVSVSCNPATFARDGKILMEGGYRLAAAQIVDQFLWSGHVEIVGVFRR